MKTTVEFLDAVKRRHGIESDYAAAKLLGVTRQQVSRYRNEGDTFSDLVAVRVAELLELNPMHVIAVRNAQRANRTDEKKLWQELARKAAGAAIGLMLAGFLAPIGDQFSAIAMASANKPDYMLYAIAALALARWAVAALARSRRYVGTSFFGLGRLNASRDNNGDASAAFARSRVVPHAVVLDRVAALAMVNVSVMLLSGIR